jgi:hypothetical protein
MVLWAIGAGAQELENLQDLRFRDFLKARFDLVPLFPGLVNLLL